MRKFSLVMGALGGAMAGYLFSNAKLREELAEAKDAEAAGKIFAKHLSRDSKEVGTHVKQFIESDDVQKNLGKAQKYAAKQMATMNKKMKTMMKKATVFGKKKVKAGMAQAKGGMKKAGAKMESKMKKSA